MQILHRKWGKYDRIWPKSIKISQILFMICLGIAIVSVMNGWMPENCQSLRTVSFKSLLLSQTENRFTDLFFRESLCVLRRNINLRSLFQSIVCASRHHTCYISSIFWWFILHNSNKYSLDFSSIQHLQSQ